MDHLRWPAAALIALVLGLASCGGEEETAEHAGDVGRYCELSAEVERSAGEHFAGLGEGATRQDFEQAHAEFIAENEAEIGELEAAAPTEIEDDVTTVLAGMRAQAGEDVEVSEAEIDAADQRLREFERESC